MGLCLSVLVGCVGAVELVSCIHYISDVWLLQQLRTQNRDALQSTLTKYQDEIRESLDSLQQHRAENAQNAMVQDGIEYVNGYRKEKLDEELRIKFEEKMKEIMKRSHLDEHQPLEHHLCENGDEKSNKLKLEDELNNRGDIDEEVKKMNEKNDEKHVDENNTRSVESKFNEVNEELGAIAIDTTTKPQDFEKTQSLTALNFNEYDGRASQDSTDTSSDETRSRRLQRDDGSGRRKAFRKRYSEENQDSKLSREEELKMFTSLEEDELNSIKRNYNPIKYSSEPSLVNEPGSSKRHRRHNKNYSESNILELDENLRETIEVDEIGGDEVTHPWGDIKPEMRRDSGQWKRLKKAASIDEKPELEGDIENFLHSERCADMVIAGCSAAVAEEQAFGSDTEETQASEDLEEGDEEQEDEKSRARKSKSKKHGTEQSHYQRNHHHHHDRRSHVSSGDEHSYQHAVVVVSPATTINITGAINDTKFEELQSRLQKIEQAIEQKISDWTSLETSHSQYENFSSDEEPHYGHRHRHHHHQHEGSHTHHYHGYHHQHVVDPDQVEIDFQKVLEDNDIEMDEDFSYLPVPIDSHLYVLHSDEEPGRKRGCSSGTDSNMSLDSGSLDGRKRNKIRKHRRSLNVDNNDDSDTETSMESKRRHKRKSRSHKHGGRTKHPNYDMLDELSDTKDDKIVFVEKIGNEKEFVMDSDEEPFYGEMTKRRNAITEISEAPMTPLTPETDNEYFMLQYLDSDEEPDRKVQRETSALPKNPIVIPISPTTEMMEVFHNKIIIPMLGHVQQHTCDSDEEPYYRDSAIIYDIPDEELRARCIIKKPTEFEIRRRQQMYEDHEIEEDVVWHYEPLNKDNYRYRSLDSDEEPTQEERDAYEERMRRSKSPSRSPFCEHATQNRITQNFIDIERETEEVDRTSKHESPRHHKAVIHLGLIGSSRTTSQDDSNGDRRRKYKWEETLESELGDYQRGELSIDCRMDDSRRESAVSGISSFTETTETNYDDSYDDDEPDHAWASETETTQRSVIERRMTMDIFSNSDNENEIDEIQDEEVPNGNYSGPDDSMVEGAVGYSSLEPRSSTINVPQNSERQSVEPDLFDFGEDSTRITTLRHSPKMYDLEKVESMNLDDEFVEPNVFEQDLQESILAEKLKEVEMIRAEEDEDPVKDDESPPKTKSGKIKKKKMKTIKVLKRKSITKETDEGKGFESQNFLIKEREGVKVLEANKSSTNSEFLEHERNEKPKREQTPFEPEPVFETLNYDILQRPDESLDEPVDPTPKSGASGAKRKSIGRPDPIYLLRESMYPFY